MSEARRSVPPMPEDLRDRLERRGCACHGKNFPRNHEFVYSTTRDWHCQIFFHNNYWAWLTRAFERCPASLEATPDRIEAFNSRLDEMLARLDSRNYQKFTFEDFKDIPPGINQPDANLQTLKWRLNQVVSAVVRGDLRNVWLFGPSGHGKTHAGSAILRRLTTAGKHCVAYSATELFDLFRLIAGHDADPGTLDTIANHDVVLIDNLEDGRITDAVRDNLREFLNRSKGVLIWTTVRDPVLSIPDQFEPQLATRMLEGTQSMAKIALIDFSTAPKWRGN